jgi:hypothetical protein
MFMDYWLPFLMLGSFISVPYFLILIPFKWRADDWIQNKEIRPYLTMLLIQYIVSVAIIFSFSWVSCLMLDYLYYEECRRSDKK